MSKINKFASSANKIKTASDSKAKSLIYMYMYMYMYLYMYTKTTKETNIDPWGAPQVIFYLADFLKDCI